MADDETEELRIEQIRREREARARAEEAGERAEERAEQRRAERAAYLKEKLDERESEERVTGAGRPSRGENGAGRAAGI